MAQESELGQTQSRERMCYSKRGISKGPPLQVQPTASSVSQGQENEVGGQAMDLGAADTWICSFSATLWLC